jgi:hypothetical protein
MKRKLFTLLLAFVALAGFQASAASAERTVWVRSKASADTNIEYASLHTTLPSKLSYVGGSFRYVAAAPGFGPEDKILVRQLNTNTNLISFNSGTNTLTLSYTGLGAKSEFVVFQQKGSGDSTLVAQPFNNGLFSGYVGVQATGTVNDDNVLIVVYNASGVLSLRTYREFKNYRNAAAASRLYALYVSTEPISGRWATAADFASCKFIQFTSGDASNNVLEAQFATDVRSNPNGKKYSVFVPQQVDWIGAEPTGPSALYSDKNITSATSPNDLDWNYANRAATSGTPWDYGTQDVGGNKYIPLFTLATPESSCQVLSVSRQNDLVNQSEVDGGYANKLEIRNYATYYEWTRNNTNGTWTYSSHQIGGTTAAVDAAIYTSLQKFAIWINDDGTYTLYPAASYFWKYGEPKNPTVSTGAGSAIHVGTQVDTDNIVANSVLLYNDINIAKTTVTDDARKSHGMMIGYWNGRTTSSQVTPYIGTVPNVLQSYTDYAPRKYTWACKEETADISGRFYFLEVYPDTAGLGRSSATATNAAFRSGSYQAARTYVLSVQLSADKTTKHLVVVPKDSLLSVEQEYWRYPYDSVNMAAQWEIQSVSGGYLFVNMLGDTLQYDAVGSDIVGGSLVENGFISGEPSTAVGNEKYFGRPSETNEAWPGAHWFDENTIPYTAGTTQNVWSVHKLAKPYLFGSPERKNAFYLTLPGLNAELAWGAGWYKGANSIGIHDQRNDLKTTYYQKDVNLVESVDPSVLADYAYDARPSCHGLLISLKPIWYVPTWGPFTGEETSDDGIINTSDIDADGLPIHSTFLKQDSLTAYTFLTGNYDIKEATKVNNDLKLSYATVELNDGRGTTVDVARFVNDAAENVLEFIPLEGTDRTSKISSIGAPAGNGVDTLFGETYKWYLVKNSKNGKYLNFDTVNIAAASNRQKVGLLFNATTIENALPIRLYQPLVGDKKNNNFLFQFHLPVYTYYPNNTIKYGVNVFPNLEVSTGSTWTGGGSTLFATLDAHSNYIHATLSYTGGVQPTRFTFAPHESQTTCCPSEFIDPQWLGAERLLNLPLNNQIWVEDKAVAAWISKGTPTTQAIVNNESAAKSTTLTHTYVTKIHVYGPTETYAQAGIAKVAVPHNPFGTDARGDTTWYGAAGSASYELGTFKTDLDVPLYYVQNDEGKYLTVVPNTKMRNDAGGGSTVTDVNGIRLEWQDRIVYTDSDSLKYGYDRQVLQLFAISGCKDKDDANWYGKFIYLPLASYQANYIDGTIVQSSIGQNAVFFNWNLGKAKTTTCSNIRNNDVNDCFRISQYAAVADPVKDLVVFNASSQVQGGSLVPVEFKLSKQEYVDPKCDYKLVLNANARRTDAGRNTYFTFNGTLPATTKNLVYAIPAHWQTVQVDAKNDPKLYKFVPELKSMYETAISQTKLTGEYYFVKEISDGKYAMIDVSGYANNNFRAVIDTVTLTCTDHNLPFYNLEADYPVGSVKLAILEVPFLDRNLTYDVPNDGNESPTAINRSGTGKTPYGWQTYVKQLLTNDFSDAEYLNVYQENKRYLTDALSAGKEDSVHMIPYYSFSVVKDGKEYFLNVDVKNGAVNDSVYWSELTTAEKTTLLDWENNPTAFPKYKFCLPYKLNADGSKVETPYGDTSFPAVYLQTLDLARTDYPYLVITGSATKYVTSRHLNDAILPGYSSVLDWNIYTMDYTKIDPMKVTSWILGGPISLDNEWVPLLTDGVIGSKTGLLTDFNLGNATFIIPSGQTDPVNYGIITGFRDCVDLSFEYGGDTLIGNWSLKPIWYYRIKAGDVYLTDATGSSVAKYPFQGQDFNYGYFTAKIADYAPYASQGIKADQKFVQTFGFKYTQEADKDGSVKGDADANQAFYVVSNANYTTPKALAYRYLAEVNNHLVFVNDVKDALVFQFGQRGDNGYTGIEVVGKGGIFAVDGGVRIIGGSGKVDFYSIDGRLIKSAVITGADQVIPAPQGVSIVKNAGKVVKVVVK